MVPRFLPEARCSAGSATPSCVHDAAAQEVLTHASMDHSEFWTKPSSLRLDVEGVDGLDVREFKIHDRLNELFSVELVVVSKDPALDLESLIGQGARFTIELDEASYAGTPRRNFRGIVSEMHHLRAEEQGLSTYQLTVSPEFWLLTQRSNCRVFQQMTDVDIVKTLLSEWNLQVEDRCASSFKPRKYRVQYQETDFAFVSRLLEAAGVTYTVQSNDSSAQILLIDAPERGQERSTPLEHQDAPMATTRYATKMRASRAVTSGHVSIADHDHRMPNAPLVSSAVASQQATEARLEKFMYAPGAFRFGGAGPNDTPTADDRGRTRTDMGEARRIASQVAAASMARARRYQFESNSLDLIPGMRVTVMNTPIAERVGQVLITGTTISGTHDTHGTVIVEAASAAAPYKPEMRTPRPAIYGIETATVVGPAGEELHCDEFGRVRVQFHWDRYGRMDEMSSCWIPVNQPWAGGGLGGINIPRIGQEVMVSFLGGDPEEPMVVGRMFTNLNRPPWPLPGNVNQNGFKSRTIGGAADQFNMFRTDDTPGQEEMAVQAEKDFNKLVKNDETKKILRHKVQAIGGNRSNAIAGSDNESVDGNQTQSVLGEQLSSVLGNKMASVLGDLISSAGGQRVLQTALEMASSALAHRFTSETGTTLSVGQSMIHMTPDAIVIQSPKILLNPGEEIAQQAVLTGQTPAPAATAS